MDSIEIGVRLAASTLFLVQAMQIFQSRRIGLTAGLYAGMAVCLTGFLATHSPIHAPLPAPVWTTLSVLSKTAALFIWLFLLRLFDDRFRPTRFHYGVAALWMLLVPADFAAFSDTAPEAAALAGQARIGLSVLIAGHLAWRLAADWRVDLVERRRRLRLGFAIAMLALFVLDLVSDFLLGFNDPPLWYSTLQKGGILIIALAAQLWLTRFEPSAFRLEPHPNRTPRPADPAEARLLDRLEDALAKGVYLDPELSVGGLAKQLGATEARLRALINQRLGHRNFRTFLNRKRVAHAQALLADPVRAAQGMLAIALDSGFASLPSFNRAFRESAGQTPSEWRRAAAQRSESASD